jgi:hypothetical protein
MSEAKVDVASKTVELDGTSYKLQELSPDNFAVLVAGVPVGRVVYSWGAANGVSESEAASEETLTVIAEAWFAATES